MTYEEWKRILEPVSIFIAGALAFGSFQKLYRSAMGLPPCGEVDKVVLDIKARIARFDALWNELEKRARSSHQK